MICIQCDKYPQINKKYKLCQYCNRKRLHPNENIFEKQKTYFKRLQDNKKQKPIKDTFKVKYVYKSNKKHKISPISSKQAEIKKELHKVYNEIDREREPVCQSCNQVRGKISHSHIISVKKRPDLATDKNNIILECCGQSDYCHEKWESGNIDKMKSLLTFNYKLSYIKQHDTAIYEKLINKC